MRENRQEQRRRFAFSPAIVSSLFAMLVLQAKLLVARLPHPAQAFSRPAEKERQQRRRTAGEKRRASPPGAVRQKMKTAAPPHVMPPEKLRGGHRLQWQHASPVKVMLF